MTDIQALTDKLSVLTAESDIFKPGGARVISQNGSPHPLAAILSEIDNAVLERSLKVDIDGVTIDISVAGRRMRGILEISGRDAPADIIGTVLNREDPQIVQNVGTFIQDLCRDAKEVTVYSAPMRPLGNSAEAGLSTSNLLELWPTDSAAAPDAEDVNEDLEQLPPLARFLAINADMLAGYIYIIDGAVADADGHSAPLSIIWDTQAAAFAKRHKALRKGNDGPVLVCLEAAISGELAAALATSDDETVLMAYKPGVIAALMASWYKSTA